jgi:hypothetical protein
VLLGGGTPPGEDAGAVAIAAAATAIKERWPSLPVYAMIAPPRDLSYVDLLADSGVDELGINVELFSDDAAAMYVPGKHRLGLDYFLTCLSRAVARFASARGGVNGVGTIRSITVVGLEPEQETLRGVDLLASIGVMPILTPFRAMAGTELECHLRWSSTRLWELTLEATQVADKHGMPLGPTCIPCQSNTLNIPGHPLYRYY